MSNAAFTAMNPLRENRRPPMSNKDFEAMRADFEEPLIYNDAVAWDGLRYIPTDASRYSESVADSMTLGLKEFTRGYQAAHAEQQAVIDELKADLESENRWASAYLVKSEKLDSELQEAKALLQSALDYSDHKVNQWAVGDIRDFLHTKALQETKDNG